MTREQAVSVLKMVEAHGSLVIKAKEMAIQALEDQKVGRWIATENEEIKIDGFYCSECDLPMETEEKTPYCPNCGARMVVDESVDELVDECKREKLEAEERGY